MILYKIFFCILGKSMQDVCTFIASLKDNKVMLNQDADKEVYISIEDKINLHNVAALYQLSHFFKFSKLRKSTILFIERFFPIISESQNFLHLDYKYVVQIFSSSYLTMFEQHIYNLSLKSFETR